MATHLEIKGQGRKPCPDFSLAPTLPMAPFVGVGLRTQHYPHLAQHAPKNIDWFEAITENYLDTEGRPLEFLLNLRKNYPIALHGVALSIGSPELDLNYLRRLKTLVNRVEPFLVSDHLCFSRIGSKSTHDLLPMPLDESTLSILARNIRQVQDILKRELVLENISYYLRFGTNPWSEPQFISELVAQTGCKLLLDLNNVYVNSVNFNFNVDSYLSHLPFEAVQQVHLAGFTTLPEHLFDNHVGPVPKAVWDLLEKYAPNLKKAALLIEWDEHIPTFEVLEAEAYKVRTLVDQYLKTSTQAHLSLTTRTTKSGRSNHTANRSQTSSQSYTHVLLDFLDRITAFPSPEPLATDVVPAGSLTPQTSLQVYRDGYTYRLTEALCETYEAVGSVIGEEDFLALSEAYIQQFPSESYNLSDYGRAFSDYLRTHSVGRKCLSEFPFLADLAEFEWTFKELFHTAPPHPDLGGTPGLTLGENTRFFFPASARVLSLNTSVYSTWKNRKNQTEIPEWNKPEGLFLYKTGQQIRVSKLLAAETGLLSSLFKGDTLSTALDSYLNQLEPKRVENLFLEFGKAGVTAMTTRLSAKEMS